MSPYANGDALIHGAGGLVRHRLGRVFVVATITAGPGALAFCAVVVLTMLASMQFDPRLIWDPVPPNGEKHA